MGEASRPGKQLFLCKLPTCGLRDRKWNSEMLRNQGSWSPQPWRLRRALAFWVWLVFEPQLWMPRAHLAVRRTAGPGNQRPAWLSLEHHYAQKWGKHMTPLSHSELNTVSLTLPLFIKTNSPKRSRDAQWKKHNQDSEDWVLPDVQTCRLVCPFPWVSVSL